MRDTCIAALTTHLGLEGDGGVPVSEQAWEDAVDLSWCTPELEVRLHCRKLVRALAHDLALLEGRRHSAKAVAEAVHERRRQIGQFLAEWPEGVEADRPSVAVVEIDRPDDFTSSDHDAKFAVRLGCADAGVLTQFTAVPKQVQGYDSVKDKEFRAAKAWDDALRQLGVRVHPEHTLGDRLPEGLRFAAVWMVRKTRRNATRAAGHLPVAVLVTPDPSTPGQARVEGWDDEVRAWVPYPVLLLRLARRSGASVPLVPAPRDGEAPTAGLSYWADRTEQRRACEEWLQRVRRSLRGTPTMLLAHGQNMRAHWTWLQDGKVVADRLRDGHAPMRRIDPDLYLVRVRTARGRETPQWWAENPAGANGLTAHLWTAPVAEGRTARVFWSATEKARTAKLSVAADKLAPRTNSKGKLVIDTNKAAWNPALVELAVLGCHLEDGDVPEALALAAHQLRQAPDLPDALSLPLPLHLAGLAQEYVLPFKPAQGETPDADAAADGDPDEAAAPGLDAGPEEGQLALFDAARA
ncbi:RNaseH domain-containing protein [Streptomyces sp. MST-110588]|uniref:RNaseH domain-containing protein n=1 Tax=Streptomyces sp. MST-110588 TaxID=2833628 RepID=UPI001F5D4A8A|nr:RNaseH domain-containing protein [Streptomyces sp. MST-110588]UNO39418.1 DUF3893 domain-containing protein [Streptomyces sp. MST-110588]